jgi:YidC/Oxa1 family membrane protein insertase
MMLSSGHLAIAAGRGWLLASSVDGQMLVGELARLQALTPADARQEAAAIETEASRASGSGAQAAAFLRGVALERAGDTQSARALYAGVAKAEEGRALGESARFRLTLMADEARPAALRESSLKHLLSGPDVHGWFVVSGQWGEAGEHYAVWRALVDLRSGQISFAFFSFLSRYSPWHGHWAFLWVLVVLSAGAKLVQLPLLAKSAAAQGKIAALQPEIRRIQAIYSADPVEAQKRIMALYEQHGVDLKSGCLVVLADIIFVIWVLFSLASYGPQFALDGSSFGWVADVTAPDWRILVVWAISTTISSILAAQPGQRGQMIGGGLITGLIFSLIAWYWAWPAYMMIYWTLLSVCGIVITVALYPIRRSAQMRVRTNPVVQNLIDILRNA